MIHPTIGRQVWFRPNGASFPGLVYDSAQPLAATVVYVWHDHMVNLAVLDQGGMQYSVTSVLLLQGDAPPPLGTYYCEWMPYQKGQARAQEGVGQVGQAAQHLGVGSAA